MALSSPTQGNPLAKSTGENGWKKTKYYLSVADITFSVQLTVDSFCLKDHNGGFCTTQSPLKTI